MKLGCDGRTQALETSAMRTCTRGRNSQTRPTSNRYRQRRKPLAGLRRSLRSLARRRENATSLDSEPSVWFDAPERLIGGELQFSELGVS
jgi:hypothetical protein